MTPADIESRLLKAGYTRAKAVGGGKWIAMRQILNGYAIARGNLETVEPDHWFYNHYDTCSKAFEAWDGKGKPAKFNATFAQKQHGRVWDAKVK